MRGKVMMQCLWLTNLQCICKIVIVYFLSVVMITRFNLRHTVLDNILFTDTQAESARLLKENNLRYHRAIHTLKTLNNSNTLPHMISDSTAHIASQMGKVGITITITTVSRQNDKYQFPAPNYLTQTMAAFLDILNAANLAESQLYVKLGVCNADIAPKRHSEIRNLPNWITVYEKFPNKSISNKYVPSNAKNKRKEDQIFCLEKSLEQNTPYILMTEDDAMPKMELFEVIGEILFNIKEHDSDFNPILDDITFMKFYHPERLLGFIALDAERLPELFSISAVLASAYVYIYTKLYSTRKTNVKCLWFSAYLFCLAFVFFIGRPNFSELRRFSKYLYQVTPSPSCCTQAVLYSRKGAETIAEYLKVVNCSRKFAADSAIDKVVRDRNLITKLVQPSLFEHIGHFSSLYSKFIYPFNL